MLTYWLTTIAVVTVIVALAIGGQLAAVWEWLRRGRK